MWKYAWREIVRRKNRSIAAIISFALAVIIFSALISLLQSSDDSINKTLLNTGTHFIAFKPSNCNCFLLKDTKSNEGFLANGTRSAVLPIELLDEIKKYPSIGDASPMLMFLFHDSAWNIDIKVAGFFPENKISVANTTCAITDLIEGSFITSDDSDKIMIEHSFSISRSLHIGSTIKIADKSFVIKGIINAGIRPVKADVYMPFQQAEKVISTRTWNPLQNQMNIILVESANAHFHNRAMQDVKNLLGRDNLVSSYSCHKPAASAMDVNKQTLISASILITLFILIHVIRNQYASVVERKREIGILHSIGWSKISIISFIVYEFVLQSLIGGIAGSVIIILYRLAFNSSFDSLQISLTSFLVLSIGFALTFITSLVSAFIIAYRAASLQAMKNLRIP